MRILAIESSCDETSAAVVEKDSRKHSVHVLSNITATSIKLHVPTGGIIPENAARMQVEYIMPVIIEALLASKDIKEQDTEERFKVAQKILKEDIEAVAITYGPGLIGSLLVGVETSRTLSFALNKPLIPVNHLLAHIYANFISSSPTSLSLRERVRVRFPFIALIVSGGHTDLLFFESHTKYTWLGGTRDDAAGEALDKIGRLIGVASYPAGAEIEGRAKKVSKSTVRFHSPLLHEDTFDFSFSGLKTEVLRFVQGKIGATTGTLYTTKGATLSEEIKNEICAATQKAIVDVLVNKTLKAVKKYNIQTILLGGGVSANQTLKKEFELKAKSSKLSAEIFTPAKIYCTDNAAMIGAWALFNPQPTDWKNVKANPELYFT